MIDMILDDIEHMNMEELNIVKENIKHSGFCGVYRDALNDAVEKRAKVLKDESRKNKSTKRI